MGLANYKSLMELVKDYLFRFWQARSKCFSQVVKIKIVKILVVGLTLPLKKLVN